jgi:hypothetical protein
MSVYCRERMRHNLEFLDCEGEVKMIAAQGATLEVLENLVEPIPL